MPQHSPKSLTNDKLKEDQARILTESPYAEQLRRLGYDLLRENDKLICRIEKLEQALEEEKASVRLLKAVQEAEREQRRGEQGSEKRNPWLVLSRMIDSKPKHL